MSATHLSGPLFSGGVMLGVGQITPNQRAVVPGGQVFFVGNYPASTSLKQTFANGNGLTPDSAFSALFGANGALAALANRVNCGDIIYVLPGHSESVSAADAASHTGTAAGFSIVGLGTGTMRPAFNWTAAASTWLLDTANVELCNLILNLCGSTATGALTVTTPITVSAAGCRIVDCAINWGQDTDTGCGSTLGAIAVTAADFEFLGNRMVNLDTAGTLAVSGISLNGADNALIRNNYISGGTTSTTVGAIHCVTTASLNVRIQNNYIENRKASSTKALSSAIAGVTGVIAYNSFFVNSGIVAVTTSNLPPIYQNYTSNTAAKNGALDVGAGTSV